MVATAVPCEPVQGLPSAVAWRPLPTRPSVVGCTGFGGCAPAPCDLGAGSTKEERGIFDESTYMVVGDGTSTLFWKDKWPDGKPIRETASDVYLSGGGSNTRYIRR